MRRIRVIPVLLVRNGRLVKTVNFKKDTYIGDPMNAIKIFNDKEVDELVVLDISASAQDKSPNLEFIRDIASECFMPLCYGGGIKNLDQIKRILNNGVEKVCINSSLAQNPNLITEAAQFCGSSSVVVAIDVKKNLFGNYSAYAYNGTKKINIELLNYVRMVEELGAGELFINSIDRDGLMQGYDIHLLKTISEIVKIPVVACGGAGNVKDFLPAINEGKASAVAAGSMFVFNGKHKAVLISYPSQETLISEFYLKLSQ